jgi:hypothetical protein
MITSLHTLWKEYITVYKMIHEKEFLKFIVTQLIKISTSSLCAIHRSLQESVTGPTLSQIIHVTPSHISFFEIDFYTVLHCMPMSPKHPLFLRLFRLKSLHKCYHSHVYHTPLQLQPPFQHKIKKTQKAQFLLSINT